MDFLTAQNTASHDWGMEAKVVTCKNCGAETIQNKLQLSGMCPFCGSTTVEAADPAQDMMAPNGIIPFKITEKRAFYIFKDWIKDRFLAPELLAENAQLNKFYGIYVPLFTFDVLTENRFTGRYSEDGRTLLRCGKFQHQVDDFPVVASKQLASDKLLLNVIKDHYLKNEAGRQNIPRNLKGVDMSTDYFDLKYKYLIVPVWINSFYYDNKLYMIVINGQTGKIDGQWPKSFGTFAKKAALFFLGSFGLD